MNNALQNFLADQAIKSARDLETSLLRLPLDNRWWSAGGDARSALDMVAELAILNGTTANTIQRRAFPVDFDFKAYASDKDELAQDWARLQAMLHQNAARVAEVIRAVPDEELSLEIQTPFGPMTLTQLSSYPYWNAIYHEGQINFIALMLGCLK